MKVAISGLRLSLPRHSWSTDMLSIISPSASMTVEEGAVSAMLTKPEILWAIFASADSEVKAGKASQRRIWHGGNLEVNVETRRCQVGVRHSVQSSSIAGHEHMHSLIVANCYVVRMWNLLEERMRDAIMQSLLEDDSCSTPRVTHAEHISRTNSCR